MYIFFTNHQKTFFFLEKFLITFRISDKFDKNSTYNLLILFN